MTKVDMIVAALHNPSEDLQNIFSHLGGIFMGRLFYSIRFFEKTSTFLKTQTVVTNELILESTLRGAEWTICLDDDEFLCGDLKVLDKISEKGYNRVYCDGYWFYDSEHYQDESCPAKRMIYRTQDGRGYENKKVFFKNEKIVITTDGNHWVRTQSAPQVIDVSNFELFHYKYRREKGYSVLTHAELEGKSLIRDNRLSMLL